MNIVWFSVSLRTYTKKTLSKRNWTTSSKFVNHSRHILETSWKMVYPLVDGTIRKFHHLHYKSVCGHLATIARTLLTIEHDGLLEWGWVVDIQTFNACKLFHHIFYLGNIGERLHATDKLLRKLFIKFPFFNVEQNGWPFMVVQLFGNQYQTNLFGRHGYNATIAREWFTNWLGLHNLGERVLH